MNTDIEKIAAAEHVSAGTVEKDMILTIVLAFIGETGIWNKIVFKGGTAIKKVYYPNARFSVELDFDFFDMDPIHIDHTARQIINLNRILDPHVKFDAPRDINTERGNFTCKVPYVGPLKHNNSIKLDFSARESPRRRIQYRNIIDKYGGAMLLWCTYRCVGKVDPYLDGKANRYYKCELKGTSGKDMLLSTCWKCGQYARREDPPPPTSIQVMGINEILAEKVRALVDRTLPRDLYDVYFLLKNGVVFDKTLIEEKLELLEEKMKFNEFVYDIEKNESLRAGWKRDLEELLPVVPNIEEVITTIKEFQKE